MKSYQKSVLEYSDVRSAIKYAEEKGFEKGFKIGFKIGIKQGREQERIRLAKLIYKDGMSIEYIACLMGFSDEQLSAIFDRE
jgi:DNA invertase Pin-like site-specific DNA recombinase